jgi:5-methylcytosine-specific restriction endonuclease McrA
MSWQTSRPVVVERIRGRRGVAMRERIKRRSPLCQDCQARGRIELATQVHHVVALQDGGTNAESNLVQLCHRCHQRRHGQKPRHQRVGLDGWPLPDD